MHEGKVIEEIVGQDGLYASDDTQTPLAQAQGIEHTRGMLIIGTAVCTLCQNIPKYRFRTVWYSVSACQQVHHVFAEEALIHMVYLWLLRIVWCGYIEV